MAGNVDQQQDAQQAPPPPTTTQIMIKIDIPNGKKRSLVATWDLLYRTLAEGEDDFEFETYKNEILDRVCDQLNVCHEHCSFNVKLKATGKVSICDRFTSNFVRPEVDALIVTLDNEECIRKMCDIGTFRKEKKPPKPRKKKSNKKPPKRKVAVAAVASGEPPKKRRKKNEISDYEEEEDNSTNDDEFDPSKMGSGSGYSASQWCIALASVGESNKDKGWGLSSQGVVEFTKLLANDKNQEYDIKSVPAHILKKYGKKKRENVYKAHTNHSNYGAGPCQQPPYPPPYPHQQQRQHPPQYPPPQQYAYPPPHYPYYPPHYQPPYPYPPQQQHPADPNQADVNQSNNSDNEEPMIYPPPPLPIINDE